MMRKGCKARGGWDGMSNGGCLVSGIMLLLTLAFAGAVVLAVTGCAVSGSREISGDIFGFSYRFTDKALPDSTGKTEYSCGFDEESNVLKWLLGWMAPEDAEAPPETGETP